MFRNLALVLLLATLPLSAAENVSAFGPVARANISAIGPVAIANVAAIGDVDNTGSAGPTLVQDSDFSTATGSDNDPISTLTATVGKDLTAAGGVRPTLQTAERNGLNVGRFDGTDDTMATAAFDANVTQPCTIVVVFKLNTTAVIQRFISSIAEEGGDRILFRFTSSPQYELYSGGSFQNNWGNTDPDTSWHVMGTCVNGASGITILDTGTAETIPANPGAAGVLTGLRLSGDYDGTINPTSVDVGQIRIWQGAMDATALAAEISTMRTKWGF